MAPPKPREPVPALTVQIDGGTPWRLADQKPDRFTLILFYRGLHCPICRDHLRDLDRRLDDFAANGTSAIAISTDPPERGERTKRDWSLEKLIIGYGLSIETARAWGLYISTGRGKTSAGIEEPALFNEPGLFLVKPDGSLFAAAVQTMPFARPHIDEVLKAVKFIIARDYPARGEA